MFTRYTNKNQTSKSIRTFYCDNRFHSCASNVHGSCETFVYTDSAVCTSYRNPLLVVVPRPSVCHKSNQSPWREKGWGSPHKSLLRCDASWLKVNEFERCSNQAAVKSVSWGLLMWPGCHQLVCVCVGGVLLHNYHTYFSSLCQGKLSTSYST